MTNDGDSLSVANRKALDRQILDNHFRGLIHRFRQLDAGLCSPDWQAWYVDRLDTLVAIFDEMLDFYKAAGIDHEVRIDCSDITRSVEKHQREKAQRERERHQQAQMPAHLQEKRREVDMGARATRLNRVREN